MGEGEATHTAEKQLTALVGNEEEVSLEQLESIFQIEKVTNEFFDKYKEKYLELKEHLEKDRDFINEALKHTEKVEDFSEEFAKKLMGQLAFLYFLQKKGWLGVKATPSKLNKAQFNALLNNKTNHEKEILNKVYKRIDENEYKRQREGIEQLTDEESDILMNCLKNTPFEGKWGDGEKKFVRKLFEQHKKLTPDKNFFEDYLEYLFYEALNSPRGENQYYKKFNCKIPFLNGGLFEPYEGYKWEETNFHIPDELFSNSKEEGILDIFDRFNFTISENEPFETEVAVDPEMLGKVFENLLDVKDRKSKGAFYTPREIVHYMCKESLINYLDNEVEEVERERLEELLQMGEFAKEYDTHLFEMDYKKGKKINDEDWGMHISVLKNIDKIDEALKNVKVADPAIGSGAFPLGMLMEIVKVRSVLTEYFIMHEYFRLEKENKLNEFWEIQDKILNKRSLYNLKIETIENCLFGVDIEPSAVEIAKLRLWLSIVVDSENDNINPLPNLDFNFMVGNSLLDEFEGIKLFDEKLLDKFSLSKSQKKYVTNSEMLAGVQRKLDGSINIDEVINWIQYLRPVYFDEKESKKKKLIKDRIDNYEWILIQETLKNSGNEDKIKELEKLQKDKRKPYFLWKLEFAEVFKDKGGFDIVIGNPPYVGEKGNKEIFRVLSKGNLGRRFYQGKMDIFYLFFHLGFDILKNNGIESFITTNYFINADSAKRLRDDMKRRSNLIKIVNFNELKVFESALGQHNLITISEKNINNKDKNCKCINSTAHGYLGVDEITKLLREKSSDQNIYIKTQANLFDKINNHITLDYSNESGDKTGNILFKMQEGTFVLDEFFNINTGVNTGCDKVTKSNLEKIENQELFKKGEGIFVISEEELKTLYISENEKKYIFKFYKNSQINKYYTDINSIKTDYLLYITKDTNIDTFNNLKKHLEKYRSFMELKREYQNGLLPWYSLHWAREKRVFVKEKIVLPYRSKKNIFSLSEENFFGSKDILYIQNKLEISRYSYKYLLSLFNSKLYYYWLWYKGKRKGDTLELYVTPISNLPVKNVSEQDQQPFIEKVEKIIELKKQNKDTTELENEIDEMVYDLYELTEEEKEIVRNFKS